MFNRFSSANFDQLAKARELHSLWLEGSLSDQQFKAICKTPNLKCLVIQSNLSNPQLQHLKQLTELSSLTLIGLNYDNDSLSYIAEIKSLQYLFIEETSITGDGIVKHLAESSLAGISYTSDKVPSSAVMSVTSLQQLAVDLDELGPQIDLLLNLKNLQHLSVTVDKITAKQVAVLSMLSSLKSLMLQSPNSSQELRFRLANSLPRDCYFEP